MEGYDPECGFIVCAVPGAGLPKRLVILMDALLPGNEGCRHGMVQQHPVRHTRGLPHPFFHFGLVAVECRIACRWIYSHRKGQRESDEWAIPIPSHRGHNCLLPSFPAVRRISCSTVCFSCSIRGWYVYCLTASVSRSWEEFFIPAMASS